MQDGDTDFRQDGTEDRGFAEGTCTALAWHSEQPISSRWYPIRLESW